MANTQSQEEWLELCKYVHYDILQYDETMKLPRFVILRLRGLAKGTFIPKNGSKPLAEYDYKTILYTFKICKPKILQYLRKNETKFTNEQHKFNGIMIFIENEINDVVIRLKNAKQSSSMIEDKELPQQSNKSAEYTKRENKSSAKLDDLW